MRCLLGIPVRAARMCCELQYCMHVSVMLACVASCHDGQGQVHVLPERCPVHCGSVGRAGLRV